MSFGCGKKKHDALVTSVWVPNPALRLENYFQNTNI